MEQIAVEIKIHIQLGQELKVLQLFAKDGDYYLSDAQGLQIRTYADTLDIVVEELKPPNGT